MKFLYDRNEKEFSILFQNNLNFLEYFKNKKINFSIKLFFIYFLKPKNSSKIVFQLFIILTSYEKIFKIGIKFIK
jgi:hypothetical protein